MAHTARSILDRFYHEERSYMSAEPTKRDFTGMASTLSKDIKLVQSPDLPYGGVYEGHAGFLQWAEIMAGYFDVLDVTPQKIFSDGDTIVLINKCHWRVRKTQEDIIEDLLQIVEVDLAMGVITEIRPWYWNVASFSSKLSES